MKSCFFSFSAVFSDGARIGSLGFFCCILCSCSLFSRYPLTVCLPDFPYPQIEITSWIIEYPSELQDGLPVYISEKVPVKTGELPQAEIRILRGVNLPVLAFPVFEYGPGGFPAGGIYPSDVSGGRIELEWESGFACGILRRCIINSDIIQAFDAAGFREALLKEAAEAEAETGISGGPWLLDSEQIICRLGYGLFRLSSIKAAETMAFEVPAAAEGLWFSDNPFLPPAEIPPGGGPLKVSVPLRLRTVCMLPDSAGAEAFYFDERRWCRTNLVSGASESGRR